jgi:hypothetical protein
VRLACCAMGFYCCAGAGRGTPVLRGSGQIRTFAPIHPGLGAYSLTLFRLAFSVKFSGFIFRKVIHISTGQGEHFLRIAGMP